MEFDLGDANLMRRAIPASLLAVMLALSAFVMRPLVDTVAAEEWSNPLTWSVEVDASGQGVMPAKPVARFAKKTHHAKPAFNPPVAPVVIPTLSMANDGPCARRALWTRAVAAGPVLREHYLCASPRGPPGAAETEPCCAFERSAAFGPLERM